MEHSIDTYLTVKDSAQTQFVEQRSRFISFIWHVTQADEVKERIAALQKEYYDARHICYAYMLGPERTDWREWRELPHLARGHRHAVGRCHRRVEHHDGDRARANH